MKLVSVVGARPQFVKAFAVSRHLRPDHEEILVHTGQHYSDDLSAVFFDELSIPDPDYNLGVGSDTHGRQTAAMIEGIEEILLEESPDIVLLYGDTNSTLAGAIAASKLDDPIAHVEAGLRSHDRSMPEEINRVLTDHVSDLLFAPSDLAKTMLEGEGITDGVHVVGDVGYDAIRWARERAADRSEILEQSALEEDNYVLGTIHRPKNTETPSRLTTIIDALVAAPQRVVVPLHPRTEAPLREYGLWEAANRGLEIIDPVATSISCTFSRVPSASSPTPAGYKRRRSTSRRPASRCARKPSGRRRSTAGGIDSSAPTKRHSPRRSRQTPGRRPRRHSTVTAVRQRRSSLSSKMTTATESELRRTDVERLSIARDALQYAKRRQYSGYDKADGLSSRLLQAVPVENRWLNIAVQESCKRAPINIRPLFLVPKRRNIKGASLFAVAYQNLFDCLADHRYRSESQQLLDWICSMRREGYAGFCAGHRHPVQSLESKTPANTPDIVTTSYAVRSLCRSGIPRYQQIATSAAEFVYTDLEYHTIETELGTGARLTYKPTSSTDQFTLNANALGARLFVDLYEQTGTEAYADTARQILHYVAANQHPSGGWKYRDPPSASHVSMDNYHNGFIIESFVRYRAVIDPDAFTATVDRALEFYRTSLYESSGAPNWDERSTYPRDIHAAAQGILVFAYAGKPAFARRIADWAINTLYAGGGRFYYQQRKHYTKRFT